MGAIKNIFMGSPIDLYVAPDCSINYGNIVNNLNIRYVKAKDRKQENIEHSHYTIRDHVCAYKFSEKSETAVQGINFKP